MLLGLCVTPHDMTYFDIEWNAIARHTMLLVMWCGMPHRTWNVISDMIGYWITQHNVTLCNMTYHLLDTIGWVFCSLVYISIQFVLNLSHSVKPPAWTKQGSMDVSQGVHAVNVHQVSWSFKICNPHWFPYFFLQWTYAWYSSYRKKLWKLYYTPCCIYSS